jgi:spermidine dehydrogenase
MPIATPYPYSYGAKALLTELGIEVSRYPEFINHELETNYKLGSAMFFDKEHFGEDRVVPGLGRTPWKEFLAKATLSEAARRDLVFSMARIPITWPA